MPCPNQLFQFHKGTIKTHSSLSRSSPTAVFQFHKGTIKTYDAVEVYNSLGYFNSIKVRLKLTTTRLIVAKKQFQFHKGTIKTGLLLVHLPS